MTARRLQLLSEDLLGCVCALLALVCLETIRVAAAPVEPQTIAAPGAQKSEWWSFKPASRPNVPATDSAPRRFSASTNPIDAFVGAKLAELLLQPSPEADRVTLIRRLSYDLTGLPPALDEVDTYAGDNSPDAYERLVDRLLASPRYGERWARHWLDVVHFGETHGYDKDKLRPNAWPYRDYVIHSLNEDKPWSRFVEEQLAGDALYPDEPDGIVALGFIAAGPWDYVGHAELPESKTDGLIARYNDRDDMVMTTFSTFQSLTVHCARCHDHKFDPISQRDYYSLQAVFAGVDRANRPYDADPEAARRRRELMGEKKALEAQLKTLNLKVEEITSPELDRLDARLAELELRHAVVPKVGKPSPSNGYHSGIEAAPDVTKWVQVDLGEPRLVEAVRLIPARPTDFPDTPGFGFPRRFRVEFSDNADFTKRKLLADHTTSDFPNPGDQPMVLEADGHRARFVRVTATKLWERTSDFVFALAELEVYSQSNNVAGGAHVTALDSIESGRWGRSKLVDGFDSRRALGDTNRSLEALAQHHALEIELDRLRGERPRLVSALVDAETKAELERVNARLAELSKQLKALPEPQLVYAAAHEFKAEGSFVPPKGMRPVHLLVRGDVKQPKGLMTPAALPAVPGPEATFNLPPGHAEGDRRAALAKWLTDPRNLQTRRSIVNRVWQYHFGRGLVDTPNDFGHMGSKPTHPELLDWLAFWFLDNGESLKKLHRLIVTSATYRQTSVLPPSSQRKEGEPAGETPATRLDGDNRYLWRQNRTRLDAECIRDAMLSVSGQLDLTMGGPSDRQFFFKDDHSPVYDYTRFDVDTKEGRRRSVYRHIVRSVTDPFMDCLDAADPSQLVAKRNTTLTALQALATLNNPFVLKQCEHFAARLQREAPDLQAQIERAYRLALSRSPTTEENQRLVAFAQQHGLANACRVLFNSTEFMFVD